VLIITNYFLLLKGFFTGCLRKIRNIVDRLKDWFICVGCWIKDKFKKAWEFLFGKKEQPVWSNTIEIDIYFKKLYIPINLSL